jgi:hypothetical protein
MPLTQTELEVIEQAFGTGAGAGAEAPNGHTVQGSLNTVVRIGTDMQEYGLTATDLPAAKGAELEEAVVDLRYYRKRLATLFADDLQDELDAIELPDGTVLELPNPN